MKKFHSTVILDATNLRCICSTLKDRRRVEEKEKETTKRQRKISKGSAREATLITREIQNMNASKPS
jgi:hypothetical protein